MNQRCLAGIDAETLSAWRSRLLSQQEQQFISSHVPECAACQRLMTDFERTAQVLRTPPRMPSQDIIWRGIQASMTPARGHRMTSQRTWTSIGVATALIIAFSVVMVMVLLHPQAGTSQPIATATLAPTVTAPTAAPTIVPMQALTVTEFSIPAGISPDRLITGPDGNLWFTDANQLQIGRMTPKGEVTLFHIPSAQTHCCISDGSDAITVGPDHNLWFTEGNAKKIGRITPAGAFTEYPVPAPPTAITSGPDGNLWFAETTGIGRMTPQGTVTEFPIPSTSSKNGQAIQTIPSAITSGPDGNLWFAEFQGDSVGRITPQGNVTQFPLAEAHVSAYDITRGPDGNLWFTFGQGAIGRITPSGQVSEFPSLAPDMLNGFTITSGPDGNLWFTNGAGGLGRITPAGVSTKFTVTAFSQNNSPVDITSGPDGNLWFTESGGKIGHTAP